MDDYTEKVKDEVMRLKTEGDEYWNEKSRIVGQARIIREAKFLNDAVLGIVSENLQKFKGDIWEMADMLVETCQKESMKFPSAEVFAILVSYVFYGRELENLL